ncbi:hypothetical protein JIN85_18965 [Luteolibacter pohnpeiensis]|uniref:Uncharacterized protein n=1 Tax=Luteolibacter pohnpeiensis TaxID=454153 RepID=A0A934SAP2_9BACT|nr:hypothetical protein [Luteolibacter pohnpeiensis]MBK1884505.1 hypothetical protein [Luteolibacter pohnpeiensis]
MSEPNPYAPPETIDSIPVRPNGIKAIVTAWEKLRLVYNGLLLIPGIVVFVLFSRTSLPIHVLTMLSILFGIGANLAFFLGPLAELYLSAFFFQETPSRSARRLLFSAGLIVSLGIILLAALVAIGVNL